MGGGVEAHLLHARVGQGVEPGVELGEDLSARTIDTPCAQSGVRQCPEAACGPPACEVAVDQRSGVAGDLANELFEVAIVSSPLFDFGDQFHRHVEGAGAALRP